MNKKIKALVADPAALVMLIGLVAVVVACGAIGWWIKANFG